MKIPEKAYSHSKASIPESYELYIIMAGLLTYSIVFLPSHFAFCNTVVMNEKRFLELTAAGQSWNFTWVPF